MVLRFLLSRWMQPRIDTDDKKKLDSSWYVHCFMYENKATHRRGMLYIAKNDTGQTSVQYWDYTTGGIGGTVHKSGWHGYWVSTGLDTLDGRGQRPVFRARALRLLRPGSVRQREVGIHWP